MIATKRLILLFVLSLLGFSSSCQSGSLECTNDIALSDYNTSGLQCSKVCDCSNLKYEGYCISGLCISSLRLPAQRKGEVRPCKLLQKIGECLWGQQEAQPPPLKDLLWGDCKADGIGIDVQENTKERCLDGLDNDCDGRIDLGDSDCKGFCLPGQTAPCYTADAKTLNVGPCRSGIKSCKDDNTWDECAGEKLPSTETCNKIDDDCDGQIDEEVPNCEAKTCLEGQQRPCYPESTGCTAENDPQQNLRFRCQGICHAGFQTCQQGRWGTCEQPILPTDETCDGIDNNCNGVVDEGCLCENGKEQNCFLGPQTQEVGECKAGKQRCDNGQWGECKHATSPTTEICDGKDNDCNGLIDDRCACTKDADCTQGLVCLEGTCQKRACPIGQVPCENNCVDTKTSNAHCGACGNICPNGKSCTNGQCICPTGQTDCNGTCVDFQTSPQHCGKCDNSCTSPRTCTNGQCNCPNGTTLCDGTCVNPQTNDKHCGKCNTSCPSTENCNAGTCQPTCSPPKLRCGQACIDPQTDNEHCGFCNNSCPINRFCQTGTCACNLPSVECNNACVDTQQDNSNCGQCNRACQPGKTCQAGSCLCAPPTTQCNNDCVDLQTNNLHCGKCNTSCASPRTCINGSCVCPQGRTFCNGDCADLQTSSQHCGACGTSCSGGKTCQAGICLCPNGQTDCNGICADTTNHLEHCGACDALCPTNATSCQNSQCICPPNTSICSLLCVNHQNNDQHCGSCNVRCPTAVCVSGSCLRAEQISVGDTHVCAVLNDGTARCWGSNGNGKLGHGSNQPTIPATAVLPVVNLSNPKQISAGGSHTCVVLQNNSVRCWGNGASGQLGHALNTGSPSPVIAGITNVKEVSAGGGHTCAVLHDGTASCWGVGNIGQLGDGSDQDRNTPTAVSGITTARQISAGGSHTCAVLNNDTAQCWGYNHFGQLGDNGSQSKSTPTNVSGLTGVKQISAGDSHTCAVLNDGTARCWGKNDDGELGDNTTQLKRTPTVVSGLSNVAHISAGRGYTCAVLNDGTARCWGKNDLGQLGDGTTQPKLTPTAVSGLTGAKQISASSNDQPSPIATCAVLNNGAAQCWGAGTLGQLGNGSYTNPQTTPVSVLWK